MQTSKGASAPRLTELAHQRVASVVKSGDVAIDATAGNGFDTEFLSGRVGQSGHVFSIDLQQEAIDRTTARLAASEPAIAENVTLLHGSHANLLTLIDERHHSNVAAVMFNLGYLPRGEKQFVTKTETTLAALQQALALLRRGGVLTIIAYPGHRGGHDETSSVRQFLFGLSKPEFSVEHVSCEGESAPQLFVATKLGDRA